MEIKNGKLIQLLGTIEETEHKSLMKFAKSPYHNSNKLIIALLQKLLTYHPDYHHKKSTKEHLYHHIHPEGKPYHEGRMNLLMTNLVDVVQRFLTYQEFEKDALLKRRLKSRAFNNRGMYKRYKKEVEGLLVDLEATPFREEDYFYEKYDLQQEFFFHIETPTGHDGAVFLYNAMDDLDQFYLTAKMKLAAEQITMTKKLNTKKEINLMNPVLDYLEKEEAPLSPVIRIYEKFLKLRIHGHMEKVYEEVKNILFSNTDKIDLLKQKLIYFNLVNHIINKNNQAGVEGESSWSELGNLYKIGIQKNFILTNNAITNGTYYNIIFTASITGDFDWSDKFAIEYERHLPEGDNSQIKSLALAFCNYYKGMKLDRDYFFKTMEFIREIKYTKKNIFIFIRSRTLWIRTCYEILKYDNSYYPTLMDYISNFEKKLVTDNTLSIEYLKRNTLSLFFIKKLVRFSQKTELKKTELSQLKLEIQNSKEVTFKTWIIEKIEELQMKFL